MRFVCGPIPPSQTFDPKEKGWTPLDAGDADARRFTIIASLLSVPLVVAAVWVLLGSRSEVHDFLAGHPLRLVAVVSVLLALVPVHELIHALAYLKGVRSSCLIMGAWLKRGIFYAIYDARCRDAVCCS